MLFFTLLHCSACFLTLTSTEAYTSGPFLQQRPVSRASGGTPPAQVMSFTPPAYRVRECNGGDDYSAVIGSVDAWWGGRRVSPMLPRLFFENFCDTSFVVTAPTAAAQPALEERPTVPNEDEGEGKEIIVGFLCGFVSPARTGEAHAHFIGIDPAHRGAGLGAKLYENFFQAVKARGCTLVHAVTSPVNTASIAFHRALGFDTVRVASSERGGEEEAGAGNAGPGTGELDGGGSEDGQAERGARTAVDSEFVHVGYDGSDGGDRVVMEIRLDSI